MQVLPFVHITNINHVADPHDAAAAADVRGGVGDAGTVGQAPRPALVKRGARVHRGVVRVGELHAAHRHEPVRGAPVAALQRRVPPAPTGGIPHGPPRGGHRAEPRHAAAEERRRGVLVAQPERAALGVVVAHAARCLHVRDPHLAAGIPHEALGHAGLVQHEAGEGGAGGGGGGEDVGDLVGRDHHLAREDGFVRRHLRDAAEPLPVPWPRPVLLGAAAPRDAVREPPRVQHAAAVSRRRVVVRAPRREEPRVAGLPVVAEPHAGDQCVRRVIERLPDEDTGVQLVALAHDEVSGLQQLRRRR
ncbi:Os04g0632750 [Oryza sativa Japonica Group]|uniref:Os04g0632750 protein n=1 Tax=Oryza sativa subsp. japonica TaxID=39947 RepID=A0A0P0WFI7_ORYSJ|nr:hypothetical protein EE612_025751 [Oryza sativa]BAS91187.1 Os04g0632750 [Oryza sativa Japonica Group]